MAMKRKTEIQERLESLAQQAASGQASWAHDAIQSAGYIHPGRVKASQLARLFLNDRGNPLTPAAVSHWVQRDGLEYAEEKDKTFRLRDVIAWRDARRATNADTEPDLLSGGDSPNLERYRAAKATLAELEVEQKRGGLVSLQYAAELVQRAAAYLRRCGDMLGRKFGNEAQEILNDALSESEREAAAWVESDSFPYAERKAE